MKLALLVVAAALAVPFAACGGEDNVTALQRIINEQLPQKIKEDGFTNVKLSAVSCKPGSAGNYNCTAGVTAKAKDGSKVKETVKITGTCNDDTCQWETK